MTSRGVHDAVNDALVRQGLSDLASKIGQVRSVRERADYQLFPSRPKLRDWWWNWRYVRRISNLALREMERVGWLADPPLFPTN